MRLRYFVGKQADTAAAAWVMAPFRRPAVPPYVTILAIDDEGRPRAGVLLNDYNGANVEITVRCDEIPLPRSGLRVVFAYVFETLRCSRVTAHVRKGKGKNKLARGRRAMMKRLGFEFESFSPRYWGNGEANGAYVYRMYPEDCPWLRRPKHEGAQVTESRRDGSRADGREQADRPAAAAVQHGEPKYANGLAHL